MRIAFVAETLGCPTYLGGISRYTLMLGEALCELGHEVHVYTLATPEQVREQLGARCPLVCHHVPGYAPQLVGFRTLYFRVIRRLLPGYCFVHEWAVPLVWRIVRDAKRGLIDIVEAPETGGRIAIGAKLIKRHIPVVARLHAPSFITAHDHYAQASAHMRQLTRMEARLVHDASAVSAPSRSVADLVTSRFGRPKRPIEVLPHPVVLATIPCVDVREAPERRVVFVGRFEVLKGFDTLLRAMPAIVAAVPNVIFDLVGPDPSDAFAQGIPAGLRAYMSAVDALGVAPAIRLHGLVDSAQADRLRAQASCVVVPSTYESFSFTLTEAMSLGRAVVASRVGGMTDIIEQGKNGLLVKPGAADELAEAVIDLLLHPDRAHAIGERARRTVETRFAPLVAARGLADFYDRVCREASGKR